MRKIKSIKDVVDWGLCTGCGACYYFCSEGAISLANIESVGIRPIFTEESCPEYQDCLSVCPGYRVNSNVSLQGDESDRNDSSILIGPALRIWRFASPVGCPMPAAPLMPQAVDSYNRITLSQHKTLAHLGNGGLIFASLFRRG